MTQVGEKNHACLLLFVVIPLQAWSCWVRTLRISFTQADLISVVGA